MSRLIRTLKAPSRSLNADEREQVLDPMVEFMSHYPALGREMP
jgi:hypothetical protein